MWWNGRYPGYEDEDFPNPEDHNELDPELYEEVLTLLPNREPDEFVEFTPVGLTPLKDPKRRSKVYNGVYRLERTDAPLVRETLEANGFIPSVKHHDWLIQWSGPHLKEAFYQSLHEYQHVNHFPGSMEITRKDRIWTHYRTMQKTFGKMHFDFMPDTYVLPDQLEEFLSAYEKQNCFWIVKPTASSRGRGIFLLRNLEELPMDAAIVSTYVERPMLIQGLKYDLRIYVLVTGWDPLRVYIYREGLTRFAVSPFSVATEEDLKDQFKHLTNYSVNKFASNFVENQDANLDNFGHKWSLSALNKHLFCIGVDVKSLWGRIIDLVIKTLLCVERSINTHIRNMLLWRQNCFEIYGFDVIIDESMKPWLLEVNLSPSMQADSPLDRRIKANLLAESFNMIRVRSIDHKEISQARWRTRALQMKKRMHPSRPQSCPDRTMQQKAHLAPRRRVTLQSLSEKQLTLLADMLSEFTRTKNFIRIFPTTSAVKRFGHMLTPSNSQGKLTATQALINLLFHERRSITSDFKPRNSLRLSGRRPLQSEFADLFDKEGEKEEWDEEEPPRRRHSCQTDTAEDFFKQKPHFLGDDEEVVSRNHSKRSHRSKTASTILGDDDEIGSRSHSKRSLTRSSTTTTTASSSSTPSLPKADVLPRTAELPHDDPLPVETRPRRFCGSRMSRSHTTAALSEKGQPNIADVLERHANPPMSQLLRSFLANRPTPQAHGTRIAEIDRQPEAIPLNPKGEERTVLPNGLEMPRRPRTAETRSPKAVEMSLARSRRETRSVRQSSPAFPYIPSFCDIEL